MNIKDHLVFCNGEEKTKEIETLQFNKCTNQWQVKFVNNSKIYFYKFSSINEYCDPEKLNLFTYQFKYKGKLLNDVNEVIRFKNHYRFFYKNGIERLIPESEIEIIKNCLSDKLCNDSLKYFQKLSEKISIKYEDGSSLLSKQFSKLQFISDKTVFASYLNPAKYPLKSYKERPLIFPFGCNESQKTAVETALRNQITLIEGPPGTGKTQTILNLIANLLIEEKKIAVVSNNNSATDNVYEKMEKYKLGFLCAVLGNSENRQNFIENQLICEIQEPKMTEEKWKELLELVDKSQKELSEYLALKNRYAQLETTYNSLLVEQQHFQNYVKEAFQRKKIDITLKLSSIQVLALKASLEDYVEKYGYKQLSWLQKLKLYIFYRIRNREFLTYSLDEIITEFEHQYYDIKQKELEEEQRQIQNKLKHFCYDDKKLKMEELSMEVLKEKISQCFQKHKRRIFSKDDLWKNPKEILTSYPVVLSTTHSIANSLRGIVYDYLIIDEASQVDLLTGALAFSCAKNVVIVGDKMQLPNIITEQDKNQIAEIDLQFQVPEGLRYGKHSLLSSVQTIFSDAPHIILREHYRCHPRIIQFCNQKFYNNQLIIMTKDKQEADVLKVYKTVAGNHARGRVNQRQIDEIKHTVLPEILASGTCIDDIGIISPYRDQTETIKLEADEGLTVDTVHKFQGREKDTIIITTVDNEITKFTDNPNLLNVAVSRAAKKLRLIISNNEKNDDTNISDLVRYIAYEKGEILSGRIYSVFDLLYKDYREVREAYMKNKKRISLMDSENLFYYFMQEILASEGIIDLDIAVHIPLRQLIKRVREFTDEEVQYMMQRNTHIDFVLYKKVDKQPIMAIEVDGERYHRKGSYQKEVRDKLKDSILKKSGLKLLRFSTTGSMEDKKLREALSRP